MRRFLLFLSSLLFIIYPQAQEILDNDSIEPVSHDRFSFELHTPKASLTGILIIANDDNEIKGSLINEFGFSALEFVFNKKKQKIKLQNVMGFINKWYIKSVLKNDLKICLCSLYDIPIKASRQHEITKEDDSLTVCNRRRNLTYYFSTLQYNPQDYDFRE